MAAKKTEKSSNRRGKMILPGAAGPRRKHFCKEHDEAMSAVKIFGKKQVRFVCKEGCDLPKGATVLK